MTWKKRLFFGSMILFGVLGLEQLTDRMDDEINIDSALSPEERLFLAGEQPADARLSNGMKIPGGKIRSWTPLRNGNIRVYEVMTGYLKRDENGNYITNSSGYHLPDAMLIADEGDGRPYQMREEALGSLDKDGKHFKGKWIQGKHGMELVPQERGRMEKNFSLTYRYGECEIPIWYPEGFRNCPSYRDFQNKLPGPDRRLNPGPGPKPFYPRDNEKRKV
jgi:hypothetical protein